MRLSSHQIGPPCNCARLHCFETTSEDTFFCICDLSFVSVHFVVPKLLKSFYFENLLLFKLREIGE